MRRPDRRLIDRAVAVLADRRQHDELGLGARLGVGLVPRARNRCAPILVILGVDPEHRRLGRLAGGAINARKPIRSAGVCGTLTGIAAAAAGDVDRGDDTGNAFSVGDGRREPADGLPHQDDALLVDPRQAGAERDRGSNLVRRCFGHRPVVAIVATAGRFRIRLDARGAVAEPRRHYDGEPARHPIAHDAHEPLPLGLRAACRVAGAAVTHDHKRERPSAGRAEVRDDHVA